MSLSALMASQAPYLRRYARALSGSQSSGDAYVVALLEALTESPTLCDRSLDDRVAVLKASALENFVRERAAEVLDVAVSCFFELVAESGRVTAFAESLPTAARPEPTFLITKPFKLDMVRAVISQALFFGADRQNDAPVAA